MAPADISGTALVGSSERAATELLLSELYEAYQVFCAYGTLANSWRSLAISLRLYLDDNHPIDLPRGDQKSVIFTPILTQLEAAHLGYLMSDALLALFEVRAVLPLSYYDGIQRLKNKMAELRTSSSIIAIVEKKELPLYLSRVYLSRIPTSQLFNLLHGLRQEMQGRTSASSHAAIEFRSHIPDSWSPSSGCYPAILLRCDIRLPPEDATALSMYMMQKNALPPFKAASRVRNYNPPKQVQKREPLELRPTLQQLRNRFLRSNTTKKSVQGQRSKVMKISSPILENSTSQAGIANAASLEVARDPIAFAPVMIEGTIPEDDTEIGGLTPTEKSSSGVDSEGLPTERSLATAERAEPNPFNTKDGLGIQAPLEQFSLDISTDSMPLHVPTTTMTMSSIFQGKHADEHLKLSHLTEGSQKLLESSDRITFVSPHPLSTIRERPESTVASFRESSISSYTMGSTASSYSNQSSFIHNENSHRWTTLELPPMHNVLLQRQSGDWTGQRYSDLSSSTDRYSFATAETHQRMSNGYRSSKRSTVDSFKSFTTFTSLKNELPAISQYHELLRRRDLIPEPMMETDWSGRGQHAEYTDEERDAIPLQTEKVLGKTGTALVESVRCKRVRLVRKVIRCNRRSGIKRDEALSEVQHLYRAQHSHIVRLVGTYIIKDDLAILTYPCAEWDLQQFMVNATAAIDAKERGSALLKFFTCLAKVFDFLHSFPIKHMDIKPQNLLVRDIRHSQINDTDPYKIYVTDFGISRSYESVAESNTETPTSFTRTYAALEVVLQESRGLAADMFSLGCVYAEMLATVIDIREPLHRDSLEPLEDPKENTTSRTSLRDARTDASLGLRPYHSKTAEVQQWLAILPINEPELEAIRIQISEMLEKDPLMRPTARQIADDPHLPFACLSCTRRPGPEDFEAAPPLVKQTVDVA